MSFVEGEAFKVTDMNKGFREKLQVSVGTVVGSLAAHFSAGEGVITTGVPQNSTEGAKREPADPPRALGIAVSLQRPSCR